MAEVKLPTIVVPKSSNILAAELRRQILLGTLPAGSPLPVERELVAQTGLSRSSVREALRILEAENLVTTRAGRSGGSIVNQPNVESFGRSISLFVHGRGIKLMALLETREAIEPALAALAACNRTDEDLQHLADVSERLEAAVGDRALFLQENVNWHMALATASRNELLNAFMHSISSMVHKASALENFATEDVRKLVIQAHRRIFAGIEAKDPEAAQRRMARHLAALTAFSRAFSDTPLVLDL